MLVRNSIYIKIGNSKDKQVLYYCDRPNPKFVGGKKEPVFRVIDIELPTRPLDSTRRWLESTDVVDICIMRKDEKSVILEHCVKVNQIVRLSRLIDNFVINITISFKGMRICD